MGPGFESNVLVFLIFVAIFGGACWLFRAQLRRALRYFRDWSERDRREEERARAEVAVRAQAERELREKLVEDDDDQQENIQRVSR